MKDAQVNKCSVGQMTDPDARKNRSVGPLVPVGTTNGERKVIGQIAFENLAEQLWRTRAWLRAMARNEPVPARANAMHYQADECCRAVLFIPAFALMAATDLAVGHQVEFPTEKVIPPELPGDASAPESDVVDDDEDAPEQIYAVVA